MADCTPYAHAPAPPGEGPCPHACGRARCRGTTDGGRCRKAPIKAATVCRSHGAAKGTPAAAKAAQRQTEAKAAELLRLYDPDAEPVVDAVAALQKLAGSEAVTLDALGRLLNRWLEQSVTCGACGRPASDPPAVLLAAFQRQDRQHSQTLDGMERLGIASRYQQMTEELAGKVAGDIEVVVRRILERLVLNEEQVVLVPVVVPEELRRVMSGGVLELEAGAAS